MILFFPARPFPPTYLSTYFLLLRLLLLLLLFRCTRMWYLSREAWAFRRTDSTSLQPLLLWPDWSPRRRQPIVILIALILVRDPPAIAAWYCILHTDYMDPMKLDSFLFYFWWIECVTFVMLIVRSAVWAIHRHLAGAVITAKKRNVCWTSTGHTIYVYLIV